MTMRRPKKETIFDCKFSNRYQDLLVACSDLGYIYGWNLQRCLKTYGQWREGMMEAEQDVNVADQLDMDGTAYAEVAWKAHSGGPIYCLVETNRHLVSSGEGAVKLWGDVQRNEGEAFAALEPISSIQLLDSYGAPCDGNYLAVDTSVGSPDQLFIACGDCTGRSYDLETGKLLNRFAGHSGYLHSILFCSKSQLVVTTSDDGDLRLWDARQGSLSGDNTTKMIYSLTQDRSSEAISFDHLVCSAVDGEEGFLSFGGVGARSSKGTVGTMHLGSRTLLRSYVDETLSCVNKIVHTPNVSSRDSVSSNHLAGSLCVAGDLAPRATETACSQVKWVDQVGKVISTAESTTNCIYGLDMTTGSHNLFAVSGESCELDLFALESVQRLFSVSTQ